MSQVLSKECKGNTTKKQVLRSVDSEICIIDKCTRLDFFSVVLNYFVCVFEVMGPKTENLLPGQQINLGSELLTPGTSSRMRH